MSADRSIMRWGILAVLALVVLGGCAEGLQPDVAPSTGADVHPEWARIKSQAVPRVALPDEYGTPERQPLSTLAWEDGVFISRDGLYLYTTYVPADILQYVGYVAEHPICPDIAPFLRGPRLDMDFSTNPWGCAAVLHSDIAYSHRDSRSDAFREWQLSGIATPAGFDGGFQALDNGDGTIDAVVSISTEGALSDLYWARGVLHPPALSDFTPLSASLNTPGQEDNPHLERLDARTLVLLFDNHGVGDPVTAIRYALSVDEGMTWTPPRALGGTVNAGPHDLHGHLYHDGSAWWLYFASERDGGAAIFRSRHLDSANIATTFDHWGPAQLVIAPGEITDGSGIAAAVGEPTLTADGDISFVVVTYAVEDSSPYDAFDVDPWYLPRR
ncbi:MAG: hypothetical protein JXB35_12515 [Anaerolineae bacterium]|nr:hypothetical protein [Anaerolineae bacterium]